jgi:hypothetical protein
MQGCVQTVLTERQANGVGGTLHTPRSEHRDGNRMTDKLEGIWKEGSWYNRGNIQVCLAGLSKATKNQSR